MPTITANGINLYYEDNGPADAPVILLVMGLGAQMIAWPDEFVQGLVGKGFRVIRYDNRDVGMSQRMEKAATPNLIWTMFKARLGLPLGVGYTLSDMAKDGIGLLDALGIQRAHVVGASMGGMIVQLMAVNYRERLLSMTSIMSSSGAPGLPGPRADIRRGMMANRPSGADRDAAVAFGAALVKSFSYPDPARPEDAHVEMTGRAFDRGYYPIGTRRQLLAILADGSRVERLKTITTPTLVVHGGADPLVPKDGSVDIARHVPGARLEIIDEMAHDLPPSQVDRMVELISGHAVAAS
ncbi:alpha/beta fold hydrolase [Sphingorhabdus pulchriflava]|uniref:Alpha/beta fold hydrolase n=1 Tax=Sphingorhabdus pulchriflava TaxID=2292257 RepID=A0A371BI97_9SPHN|nr:alpha/beta fold hydrolase [Sphingorhabdus pulchriflava]RDV07322.1 alpha/beta fold hydrolase [Sphingorhabdus pulchriflava]